MKDAVKVRVAREEDLAVLRMFEQGVVEAERPYNDRLKDGPAHYYDIAALIASNQSVVLVAEHAEHLVGSGYATLKASLEYLQHERHAYLGFMYVQPSHRGQGIIKRILEGLMEWAREHGVNDFYLDVYAANESAIRAYEKFGFRSNLIEMRLHDHSAR